MTGHLHLDAVRRLPTGGRTLAVPKHVAIVPRRANHRATAKLKFRRRRRVRRRRGSRSFRFLPLLRVIIIHRSGPALERASNHARFVGPRLRVGQALDQTGRVPHPGVFTPPQKLLPQPSATHLAVPAPEPDPLRGVRVVEPHERVVVRVQQTVLQPELRELVQPHAVVIHEGGVGRNEAHGDAARRALRRDGQTRGTRADDQDVHGGVRG